jgi:ubiquinone/menaquinone biosynthesis C-methylase UbiE
VSSHDAARERFARTAERVAVHQDGQIEALGTRIRAFVHTTGDELALDVGTGAGALAIALAPVVRKVVAVDMVPELLAEARKRVPGNVELVEADATALPFDDFSFDLVGTMRTLHHVPRPELVIAEIARVARPGATVLVMDQVAPIDPLAALELDRFERTRDPSHVRCLPDVDLRNLFESNSLHFVRVQRVQEARDLEAYLSVAGCEGEDRERARALAPAGYTGEYGWYLLQRA